MSSKQVSVKSVPKKLNVNNSPLVNKINNWASGNWIPKSKDEEDRFLLESSHLISKNCTKNPGQLGEWVVRQKLKEISINLESKKEIRCPWLIDQKCIVPDIILKNSVIEVKTLRYFNCNGKKGNQGSGSEKIDSIFRKYSNVYKNEERNTIIILVADQQFEKNGKMYLEAFNNKNYNNNLMLEKVVPYYKDTLKFDVIKFNDISKENLIFQNK